MKKIASLAVGLSLVSQSVPAQSESDVFITGSTAFRASLFNTLTNVQSAPSVFDVGTATTLQPTNANSSTSQYDVTGVINGQPYVILVSLTGSEAGIASLYNSAGNGSSITYAVPNNPEIGQGTNYTGNTKVTLSGTPLPTFINSVTGATITDVTPDLTFADTSFAVSLSNTKASPVEYGVVGVIPFTWAKGKNSSPNSSWNDLTNVTLVQLPYELSTPQAASFFTGVAVDADKVYLIGRNEGSGTRANMLCNVAQPISLNAVSQFAVNNCTCPGTVLTAGSPVSLTSATISKTAGGVHLVPVGGDGFDSGSGVAKTLECDINGNGLITLGYLGMTDAATAKGGGAVYLTLDGVAENDGAVLCGAYSFWGHEHLYGQPGQTTSQPGGVVAQLLVGTQAPGTPNNQVGAANGFGTTGSALEAHAQFGGPATPNANNSAIDPAQMQADRPDGSDTGYPSQ